MSQAELVPGQAWRMKGGLLIIVKEASRLMDTATFWHFSFDADGKPVLWKQKMSYKKLARMVVHQLGRLIEHNEDPGLGYRGPEYYEEKFGFDELDGHDVERNTECD